MLSFEPLTLGGEGYPLLLQSGETFEGRPLQFGPAMVRWALLGYPLSLANAVPALFGAASLLGFMWYVVLLISTITSDTKQGIHDRVAGTAVVQPAGLGRSVLVLTCLVLIIGWIAHSIRIGVA